MTDTLKQFLKVADKVDADKQILSDTSVEEIVESVKDFGDNIGEKVENLFKPKQNRPLKPTVPTPTYQESAFLEPKKETTLYDVTNSKEAIPEVTKKSNILKKISYTFKGFTSSANYKVGQKTYKIFLGEKVGLGYEEKECGAKTSFGALYNVRNGKSSLNYSFKRPGQSCGVSIFNKKGNNGISAYYTEGQFNSKISIDHNSGAMSLGYNQKYEDCSIELNAYVTTGDKYTNPYAGISGRVSF